MYENAIKKLREMAEFNDKFCSDIESGKIKIEGERSKEQMKHLIATYRYWFQCCLIAAWLLEQEK